MQVTVVPLSSSVTSLTATLPELVSPTIRGEELVMLSEGAGKLTAAQLSDPLPPTITAHMYVVEII